MYEILVGYLLGLPIVFALLTRWHKTQHHEWGQRYDKDYLVATIFASLTWPAIAFLAIVAIGIGAIGFIPGFIIYKLFRYIFLLALEEKKLDLGAITRTIRGRYWDLRGKLQDNKGA